MEFPEKKTTAYNRVHLHVPLLTSRQVLVKLWPGCIEVSSGIVISNGTPATMRLQPVEGVGVSPGSGLRAIVGMVVGVAVRVWLGWGVGVAF